VTRDCHARYGTNDDARRATTIQMFDDARDAVTAARTIDLCFEKNVDWTTRTNHSE
jgi:hypothetical protein